MERRGFGVRSDEIGVKGESALREPRRPTEGWKWAVCGFIARQRRTEGERKATRTATSLLLPPNFGSLLPMPPAARARFAADQVDGGHALG